MVLVFGYNVPDDMFGIPTEYFTIGLGAIILLDLWPIKNKSAEIISKPLGMINIVLGGLVFASKRGMMPQ